MKKAEENKEAKFLGTVLVLSPLLLPILEKIRDKYGIEEISLTEDGLRKHLLKSIEYNQEVDWEAVRQDLEIEIRKIPDLLPPEFAFYHTLLKDAKNMPPEPTFTEPATEKLRADVTELYHRYFRLYKFTADNIAAPWQTAIDNCFTDITDNALEFLISGKTRDIPHDWISVVSTLPMFDDNIVIAMASRMSNPDKIAEQFHQKIIDTYGKRNQKLTKKNMPYAEYLTMKLKRIPLRDIADEYITSHSKEFPKDPVSPEYLKKKRELKVKLKLIIKRLIKTLENLTGGQNSNKI